MNAKQFFEKMARARLTYQQLQQQYSPEQLEQLYANPELAPYLPPIPSPIRDIVQTAVKVPQYLKPVASVLQHGVGYNTGPIPPPQLMGR